LPEKNKGMKYICLYFQVHQPRRLRNYSVLEIGKSHHYFDDERNQEIIQKVAQNCYLPTNQLLKELIEKYPGKFRVSFSFSGVLLDQLEWWAPEALKSFQKLCSYDEVEVLGETYYHSLASVYSPGEFQAQVRLQVEKIKSLFKKSPRVFRNTELIYSDHLVPWLEKLGFWGVLAEGVDWMVGKDGAGKVYQARSGSRLKVLLRHYPLSDDIAFRFSASGWKEHPLTAEKYARWILESSLPLINIFIDYETFGEHQWSTSGIFEFLRHLPALLIDSGEVEFLIPFQAIEKLPAEQEFSSPAWLSWADMERDLSAWLGNALQRTAMDKLYALEPLVKTSEDKNLLESWRLLGTSDHFYYMSTKFGSDAQVHKYFNPHQSPYYAHIIFMRILNDLFEWTLSSPGNKIDSAPEFRSLVESW